MMKLCIERCRECTRFALFFSSSLMHSMIYLFLIIILSHTGMSLFFILALSPWTSPIPWLNRLSKSSCLMYPLSANTFPWRIFVNTVHTLLSLSSTFAPVRQNVITSPESLQSRCSLNPWHQPMVPFPFLARPTKTLPEIPSYIVTYRNHRAVNERYTRTPAEGMELHEQHHLEEHTGHEFHKAVIGDGSRESMPEPATDTVLIILLEITICIEVIAHKDRHDFTF